MPGARITNLFSGTEVIKCGCVGELHLLSRASPSTVLQTLTKQIILIISPVLIAEKKQRYWINTRVNKS